MNQAVLSLAEQVHSLSDVEEDKAAVVAQQQAADAAQGELSTRVQALAEQIDEVAVESQDDSRLVTLRAELLEDVTKIEHQLREEFVAVTVRCDKLSREVVKLKR